MINELIRLLEKVAADEDLIWRAEKYYEQYHHLWSDGVFSYFNDLLERKRDQLEYEKDRIERLGMAIAADRDKQVPDI